jgi:hypothetical protein
MIFKTELFLILFLLAFTFVFATIVKPNLKYCPNVPDSDFAVLSFGTDLISVEACIDVGPLVTALL